MKEELELKLKEKFPDILRDYGGPMQHTCMAWGMTHGDGWYIILDNLLEELQLISDRTEVKVIADQIKEKFGGLNFYYHTEYEPTRISFMKNKFQQFMYSHSLGVQYNSIMHFKEKYLWKSAHERIRNAVDNAESLSYKTCEVCGKPGKLNDDGGWMVTLCEECKNKNS